MTEANPLKSRIQTHLFSHNKILKTLDFNEFITTGCHGEKYCLLVDSNETCLEGLFDLGWGAVILPNGAASLPTFSGIIVYYMELAEIVSSGDVISISESRLDVLYRRGSNSNMLFVTEQCNHQCIMCSQPPKHIDDAWRTTECHTLIDLIDEEESVLGISGGEPTLLGNELVGIIEHCKEALPNTQLHILSNGAKFNNLEFTEKFSKIGHENIVWGIPIFGSTPQQHDYHTQREGAFNDTLHGLYNLALCNQIVELRVVLTSLVLENLSCLADFILRNLPFVSSVSLMGVEPTGYARVNHQVLWSEIDAYSDILSSAVNRLHFSSMNVHIYNVPLCKLSADMHPFAVKSISDWKNVYHLECSCCVLKDDCSGFFQSHQARFVQQGVVPLKELIFREKGL